MEVVLLIFGREGGVRGALQPGRREAGQCSKLGVGSLGWRRPGPSACHVRRGSGEGGRAGAQGDNCQKCLSHPVQPSLGREVRKGPCHQETLCTASF